MSLFLATSMLLLLVFVELAVMRYAMHERIPWLSVINNLNSGHILFWVFRGIELMAFEWVLGHFSLGWVAQWPVAVQWAFTIVAWDFCFYWLHRTHHRIPFLWSIHAVHHESEHFSLSLGIRNSWYSSLTQFPFFVGLAILGVPLGVYLVVSSGHYFIQFYNHNWVFKDKKSWLDRILVTSHVHQIHHASNPEYRDKNCGGTFVIWDKLFGTYQTEVPGVKMRLGTHELVHAENPFWVNNIPLFRWLKMPAFIGFFDKKQVRRFNDFFVAIGGFLLFGLLLFYIFIEAQWPVEKRAMLFALVFVGTIANGGLAEGKAWGKWLWIFTTTVLAAVLVVVLKIEGAMQLALFGCFAIHGIVVLLGLFQNDLPTAAVQ